MAERKYDLLLYNTNKYTQEQPKPQPWYKERIQTKFIQAHRSLALDSSQWKLFKNNPDDFRDGIPPSQDVLSPNSSQLRLPLLTVAKTHSPSSNTSQREVKKIRKKDALYSRALPAQQKRREYIQALETQLAADPTRIYPHLREAIPDQFISRYDDVISTRSPTLHSERDVSAVEQRPLPSSKRSGSSSARSEAPSEIDLRELYRFPSLKSTVRSSRPASSVCEVAESQENEEITRLTEDLCAWANQLSDKDEPLEPSHIRALFSNTFDSNKLTTLAPVQVVDLSNIPGELKVALMNMNEKSDCQLNKIWQPSSVSSQLVPTKHIRTKYGEWYVPVHMWRCLPRDEHLDIPSVQEREQSRKEGRTIELDRDISELHSASLFLKHLTKKSSGTHNHRVHIPSFLGYRERNPLPPAS